MKFVKIVMITLLLLVSSVCTPVKTKTNRLIKFTIKAHGTTKTKNSALYDEITFEKPIPVLSIDDNGVRITKINTVTDKDRYQYDMPVIDAKGNPELVDLTNKKDVGIYTEKLLENTLRMKPAGYDKRFQMSIVTYRWGKPDIYWGYTDEKNEISTGRNSNIDHEYDMAFLKSARYSINIIDEDIIYQVESLKDGYYETTTSQPINPEAMLPEERKKVLEWHSFNTNLKTGYFMTYNAGLGFFQINLNEEFPDGKVQSNGMVRGTGYANVEIKNGKLMVNADLVAVQLGGALQWHSKEDTYTFKKLVYENDYKSQFHELQFLIGSKKALFDSKEIELAATPYNQEESTIAMICLDDLAKYFNVKYHFRPIDGSLLIERFHAFTNTED